MIKIINDVRNEHISEHPKNEIVHFFGFKPEKFRRNFS